MADKKWIFRQYDHMIRTNTLVLPGSDAAVIRIKGTQKGIALSVDCNSRYCLLDPYIGGMIAICESARNLACSGAEPIGMTNCLNFGNPEKPEIMWQLSCAIEGISKACEAFGIPVVSGNVSLYNETMGKGINPTPTVAIVGLMEDVSKRLVQWFSGPGDAILLAGADRLEVNLGGSLYVKEVHGKTAGMPQSPDLSHEKALQQFLCAAAKESLLSSAHDLAEGGFACALAECCVTRPDGPIGAVVSNPFPDDVRPDFAMFAESQGVVILSCHPDKKEALKSVASRFGVKITDLGFVGGEQINIKGVATVRAADLWNDWKEGFAKSLGLEG